MVPWVTRALNLLRTAGLLHPDQARKEADMKSILGKRIRLIKFAAVGGTCFLVQFMLLTGLDHLGVYRPLANGISFAFSAQLNFALSSALTWADRPAGSRGQTGARWLAYNGTALVALTCDSAVFVGVYHAVGTDAAAVLAVVASTCLVFVICNYIIFRPPRTAPAAVAEASPLDPEAVR
jgi:putative flippase GtrA